MYAKRAGRLVADGSALTENMILEDDPEIKGWQNAKVTLEAEGLAANSAEENMQIFIEMTRKVYSKILVSRRKDHDRGSAVIEDYGIYHDMPGNDPVIKEIRERTDIEVRRAEQIISMLQQRA